MSDALDLSAFSGPARAAFDDARARARTTSRVADLAILRRTPRRTVAAALRGTGA
ncbi:MAG TPA: hypothetical protein VJ947_02540 [Pseudohaliea sp.]|nr:hypothetical protein [Pseudohaliea sp.]